MIHELKTCSVCGASDLKRISTEEHDGQLFGIYKCSSCDAELSAYDKYLKALKKAQQAEAKKAEDTVTETLTPPEEEPMNRTAVVNLASKVYKKAINSTLALTAQLEDFATVGTGTIVSPNGYFITNAHVVAEFEETQKAIVDYSEEVYGKNDRDYRFVADLAYVNPKYDLALLKTEPDAANKPVEFCYDDAFPGEDVYVIGNSKGEGLCILEGIVSDVHRSVGGKDYIMISAPVTRGNSGGPVFNSEGKMIGVVKGGHSDVNSMNFVIPIKTIIEFLQEAKDKENCEF